MDFNVGDVIEADRFGLMFVVRDYNSESIWVSDDPDDVIKGRGNTILRSEVEDKLLDVRDDDLEEWEDFFNDYGEFEDYDWDKYLDRVN